jgi:hypothetical protein
MPDRSSSSPPRPGCARSSCSTAVVRARCRCAHAHPPTGRGAHVGWLCDRGAKTARSRRTEIHLPDAALAALEPARAAPTRPRHNVPMDRHNTRWTCKPTTYGSAPGIGLTVGTSSLLDAAEATSRQR